MTSRSNAIDLARRLLAPAVVLPTLAVLLVCCDRSTPEDDNPCAERDPCRTVGKCHPRNAEAAQLLRRAARSKTKRGRRALKERRGSPKKRVPTVEERETERDSNGEKGRSNEPETAVGAARRRLRTALEEAPERPREMTPLERRTYRGPVFRVVEAVTNCNINGRHCDESRPTAARKKPAPEPPPLCVVKNDADCRQALWACELDGKCTARDGECVAGSDADCRRSYRCRRDGWCTARSGRCVAADDSDCEGSEVCELFGFCEAVDGACTLPAAERRELVRAVLGDPSGFLKLYARRSDGSQRATGRPADRCGEGPICTTLGRCTRGSDDRCVVEGSADCRRSGMCRHFGRCKKAGDIGCGPGGEERDYLATEYQRDRLTGLRYLDHSRLQSFYDGLNRRERLLYCRETRGRLPGPEECRLH